MNAPMVESSMTTRAGRWAPSEGYRSVVVGFMVAAYTLNFVDRTVVGIIGQAIKVDL
jgi:hypothetical protein